MKQHIHHFVDFVPVNNCTSSEEEDDEEEEEILEPLAFVKKIEESDQYNADIYIVDYVLDSNVVDFATASYLVPKHFAKKFKIEKIVYTESSEAQIEKKFGPVHLFPSVYIKRRGELYRVFGPPAEIVEKINFFL